MAIVIAEETHPCMIRCLWFSTCGEDRTLTFNHPMTPFDSNKIAVYRITRNLQASQTATRGVAPDGHCLPPGEGLFYGYLLEDSLNCP